MKYHLLLKSLILPVFLSIIVNVFVPHHGLWANNADQPNHQFETTTHLPSIRLKPLPDRQLRATIFAYASTPNQTDSSPFITASGTTVRDGIVAANCLPFGTVITIPALFGNKPFIVEDRLAAYHGCGSIDVWHSTTAAAKAFGKHQTVIHIYTANDAVPSLSYLTDAK